MKNVRRKLGKFCGLEIGTKGYPRFRPYKYHFMANAPIQLDVGNKFFFITVHEVLRHLSWVRRVLEYEKSS